MPAGRAPNTSAPLPALAHAPRRERECTFRSRSTPTGHPRSPMSAGRAVPSTAPERSPAPSPATGAQTRLMHPFRSAPPEVCIRSTRPHQGYASVRCPRGCIPLSGAYKTDAQPAGDGPGRRRGGRRAQPATGRATAQPAAGRADERLGRRQTRAPAGCAPSSRRSTATPSASCPWCTAGPRTRRRWCRTSAAPPPARA